MATVVFYEKPGCINNTRQKAWLASSGHRVEARDLLQESWTVERLLEFFGSLPVAQWFNMSAPRIKNGEVQPDRLGADAALQLMLHDPLLIRRPLMEVDGECHTGFDVTQVRSWIGLAAEDGAPYTEGCPRTDNHHCR